MNTVYYTPACSACTMSHIEFPEVTRLSTTVFKGMKGITNRNEAFHMCPATQGFFENVFELKSPIDFEIIRNDSDGFYTNMYDQPFWDEFIQIRNKNLLSFNIFYLIVPDFDVDIEVTSAHFTDNEFTSKTMIVPGKFNAYKWIRPIQCSFAIRDNVNSIRINRGDTFLYLRICTDKKLKLKRFYETPFINHVIGKNMAIKDRKPAITPLSYWYEMYESSKIRKKIMSEITSNTLED